MKILNYDKTFFYLGSLTDIQPLVRFTHQCYTFIYVNISSGANQESIINSFTNKINKSILKF